MKAARSLERVAPAALLLFLSLLGCQDAKLAGPQCEAGGKLQSGVGTWGHSALPLGMELPGDPAATDGSSLIVGDDDCVDCDITVLDGATWILAQYRSLAAHGPQAYVAAGRYIVVLGDPIQVIDRALWGSSALESPHTLRGVEHVHSTGTGVVLWGGSDTENPDLTPREIAEDPDTPWLWFYEGHLLDPSTGAWTHIPAAREDARYLMSEGGPSLESVWTPSGLFVWGTNPERTERWGALFHVDTMTWEILEGGGDAPPLLQSHRMLALGEDVFLFAGVTPGNNAAWRRLWRYSVPSRTWTEVDVPAWADPLVGTVVRDRIAFLGRCGGGDLYDPKTNTWKPLASEGAPPSEGIPRGAGSFLTVTDTYVGEQETNQVWILDLRQELGE